MKTRTLLALAVAGFGNASLAAEVVDVEQTPVEAGAQFQKSCMNCHQPPDLRFETDRAWVGQLRKTA